MGKVLLATIALLASLSSADPKSDGWATSSSPERISPAAPVKHLSYVEIVEKVVRHSQTTNLSEVLKDLESPSVSVQVNKEALLLTFLRNKKYSPRDLFQAVSKFPPEQRDRVLVAFFQVSLDNGANTTYVSEIIQRISDPFKRDNAVKAYAYSIHKGDQPKWDILEKLASAEDTKKTVRDIRVKHEQAAIALIVNPK